MLFSSVKDSENVSYSDFLEACARGLRVEYDSSKTLFERSKLSRMASDCSLNIFADCILAADKMGAVARIDTLGKIELEDYFGYYRPSLAIYKVVDSVTASGPLFVLDVTESPLTPFEQNKYSIYQKARVPEIVIIDFSTKTLTNIHQDSTGGYERSETGYTSSLVFNSTIYPELSFTFKQ